MTSPPLQVLELARRGRIELAVSTAILTETSRVLYDKLAWHGNDVREALELILQFAACLRLDDTLDAVLRPQVSRSEEARGSL